MAILIREEAQKLIEEARIDDWITLCLAAIERDLPASSRAAAYALLDREEDGQPFAGYQHAGPEATKRHNAAIERGLRQLVELASEQRQAVFATLLPHLASTMEAAWQLFERLPYQTGYYRRAFRSAPVYSQVYRNRRLSWAKGMIQQLTCYREQDLDWVLTWVPYLAPYNTQPFGLLFAAGIDEGGPAGDALFARLVAATRGEESGGTMGRHVTTALLVCARPAGWEAIEHLLLAAQREEGLRQVILETVDEAHPQAFLRMLRLVLEHNLLRFSATVRAADVWLCFMRTVSEVADLRHALTTIASFLEDADQLQEALERGNPQEVYCALWCLAFHDAQEAIAVAQPLLTDPLPERRLAAVHLLTMLGLPETCPPLLPLLDDPDRRVAFHAFTSLATFISEQDQADLFERCVRLLGHLAARSQTVQSGIWPWLEISLAPGAVLHVMLQCLGERDPRCLIPYLSRMTAYDRLDLAKKLVALPVWDEEVRATLYGLVGERNGWVRSQARGLLAAYPPDEAAMQYLEQFLTRKSVDLRSGVVSLLLNGGDEAALGSARRLLDRSHALQHQSGLDLLKGLAHARRASAGVGELVESYRAAHTALPREEVRSLDDIRMALTRAYVPTRENVLGLLEPGQCVPVVRPVERAVTIDTPAARACLTSLDALLEEYHTTPVLIQSWRGTEDELLGNVRMNLPAPNFKLDMAEDERDHLPLAEVWMRWERERPASERDEDGLELLRATLLLKQTLVAPTSWLSTDGQGTPQIFKPALPELLKGDAGVDSASTPAIEPLFLRYHYLIKVLFDWIWRHKGLTGAELTLLLDAAETTCAKVATLDLLQWETDEQRPLWSRQAARYQCLRDGSLLLLQEYYILYKTSWEAEHMKRYWRLLHWLDQPAPGLDHIRPSFDLLMDAYQSGEATESDILEQLGGPAGRYQYMYSGDLYQLSTWKPVSHVETHPFLADLLARLRARILEIELGRGALPTVATDLALVLRYSGGMALFLSLVTLLKPVDLVRGYMRGNTGRNATFSHLLKLTVPEPDDSQEQFARLLASEQPEQTALLAATLYAPQWARFVENALKWPGLTSAVYWICAHTRGTNWDSDEEIGKLCQEQVATYTMLTAEDLQNGAIDVPWFWQSYRLLGADRWAQLYDLARYAAEGNGYSRARLYADALLGKVQLSDLRERVLHKRQQDAVRALGLSPLADESQARAAELAERYELFQEFLRTGRKSGAQRRANEEAAVRVGMENLARVAGFADQLHLQWAMEARAEDDLRAGTLTVTEDGIQVTLTLDERSAEPRLTVLGRRGTPLKALPSRLKKLPTVAALLMRKREIEKQIARMRASLETVMCRGNHFTAGELVALLAHPVLTRLLQNLVFVLDGEQPAFGYPQSREGETGPQMFLRDHTGELTQIDLATTTLRLAHPYDLFSSQSWTAWQRECFTASRTQPFKQIFRELYVYTASEVRHGDETLSQRYSGHQVQPRQAHALLGQRGWITGYAYDYEQDPSRFFLAEGITATVTLGHGMFTPTEVEGLTIEHVYFRQREREGLLPLADVPPRVFSETMRDLDLVVSVAHSGGVDPEATASTVEMRAALVSETCALLDLSNVTLKGSYALIEGTLGHYSIHLGSAVVHRQPGGALCIIPVHAQHRGRIFLPFADNDPKTAEVMTKVIMLARDKEIKDPTILEQLL